MRLTRDYLATYTFLNSEIKRLERRLKYYNEHPLASSHGVVKGSMGNFPYAQCHFVVSAPNVKSDEERKACVNQLIIDIEGNKRLAEDMKLEIESMIEGITDIETRQILHYKYVECWTYEKIAEAMGYDRSTIGKKISKMIDSFLDSQEK